MTNLLDAPLLSLNAIEETVNILKKSQTNIQISGVSDNGLAHIISVLGDSFKNKVIVTFSEQKAMELYDSLRLFIPDIVYFPPKDFIFYNADISGKTMVTNRIKTIEAILTGSATIVTTGSSLMDKLIPMEEISNNILTIDMTSIIEPAAISSKLTTLGFERSDQVESHGQFSIRGSIIDIFPLTSEVPYRIDLFDDEVDSIKTFDVDSQRTIENVESVTIFPASEYILSPKQINDGMEKIKKELATYVEKLRADFKTEEAHRIETLTNDFLEQLSISPSFVTLDSYISFFYRETSSLFDYLPKDTVYMLDETNHICEHINAVFDEFKDSMISRLENGYLLPSQTNTLTMPAEVFGRLANAKCVHFTTLLQKLKYFEVSNAYSISMRNITSYNKSMEILIKDLTRFKKNGYKVVILSGSKTRGMRFSDSLQNDYQLSCHYTEDYSHTLVSSEIVISYGNIKGGYEFPSLKYVIISETDIFGTGTAKKKKKKASYNGEHISSFSDLSIGDYVVHENHGLGIYRGIEKMVVDKTEKDYIKIEYASNGNLYIPASSLDMIQKYASADSHRPKLNKLGSKEWDNTKARVKSHVKDIAADLVKLYAKRQAKSGFVFSPDTIWQKEFEELFPYEETSDQLAAIEDTKKDMESPKIMDRLICGDVGYGKTEVAIRAAFKAVQDGKQVVVLAPTTILAGQHYNNFVERMKDFPVTIALLSRFRTPAQQKKTLADLKAGYVDIVIGTHRVLSKDINFKNLGLLIIDEEQRFGVAHKEKLKTLRENVDVLSLSATPIPRTLHMSLVGIRDMSVLEEPPIDRLPIQTFVMEYNLEMVREAINRELARGGQVYYVYNRVNNIEEIANALKSVLPDVNIEYAHGQMSERKLEQIMYDFINGDIDVLVSTTIIETGLDISNVNTMIIHDADKLGLSQLYQLRGRIGRSNRTAYAFLMYKRDKVLKEVAEKRLMAIKEFTDLGSGFKIAMRDLEIRGAGNVLGAEQSGHMEAVGYDLYCKMLNEAVLVEKGEIKEKDDFETTVDLVVDAFIPSTYIKNELQKLTIYKRIAGIETNEEYEDMEDELLDRFGDIPKPVINLLNIALMKSFGHKVYISEISGNKSKINLILYNKAPFKVDQIPSLVSKYRNILKFVPGAVPKLIYTPDSPFKDTNEMLKALSELFVNMGGIIDNS